MYTFFFFFKSYVGASNGWIVMYKGRYSGCKKKVLSERNETLHLSLSHTYFPLAPN